MTSGLQRLSVCFLSTFVSIVYLQVTLGGSRLFFPYLPVLSHPIFLGYNLFRITPDFLPVLSGFLHYVHNWVFVYAFFLGRHPLPLQFLQDNFFTSPVWYSFFSYRTWRTNVPSEIGCFCAYILSKVMSCMRILVQIVFPVFSIHCSYQLAADVLARFVDAAWQGLCIGPARQNTVG